MCYNICLKKKNIVEAKKNIFFKIKIIARIQYKRQFALAGQYFGKVEQNLSRLKLGHILSTFHRPSQEGILWKEIPRKTPRMFFALHTRVVPPTYVPTICFKLMTLQNIMKFCFVRVPVLQWNKHLTHPA